MRTNGGENGDGRIAIVGVGHCARRLTEEFKSRYGRGSTEPSERPAATAQD